MILGLGIDSWITIATLVALMAALLFTRLRTDVVFWGVIGILFVTGVLDKSEAFSGLINSSVIIVGVMFVIVTGLSRTGVLLWMTKHILGNPKSPVQILLRLMLSAGHWGQCELKDIVYYFKRFLPLFPSNTCICWIAIWLSFTKRSP